MYRVIDTTYTVKVWDKPCFLAVCIDSSGSRWLALWRVESSQRGTRVSSSRAKSINACTHGSIQQTTLSKNRHYFAFTFRKQSWQMLLLSKLSAFLMKADKNVRLDSDRFWLDSSVHVTRLTRLVSQGASHTPSVYVVIVDKSTKFCTFTWINYVLRLIEFR